MEMYGNFMRFPLKICALFGLVAYNDPCIKTMDDRMRTNVG